MTGLADRALFPAENPESKRQLLLFLPLQFFRERASEKQTNFSQFSLNQNNIVLPIEFSPRPRTKVKLSP